MKTNKIVVALLVAILAIQSVGMVLTVIEEREQTRIALRTEEITTNLQKELNDRIEELTIESEKQTELAQKTAELLFIQARVITNDIISNRKFISIEDDNRWGKNIYHLSHIGKSINEELWTSLTGKK